MLKKGLPFLLLIVFCMASLAKSQLHTTHSFFFATDSSVLDLKERQKFDGFLKGFDSISVTSVNIIGYTDDIGRKGYNDTLSVKRAKTIKKMLTSFEISEQIIKATMGKGKLPLINMFSISRQRLLNRRVDVDISYRLKSPEIKGPIINLDTLKVGDKLVLENVLFETSRHQFLPESFETLEKLVRTLKEKQKYNIAILGHICCTPPDRDIRDYDTNEYNLSYARARMVYEYLIKNGIDGKRLSFKGMMANYPLGKGDKYDRRVELQVTSIQTQ